MISGVGARAYYQNKLGYRYLDTVGGFMVKDIRDWEYWLCSLARTQLPSWATPLVVLVVAVLLYLFLS